MLPPLGCPFHPRCPKAFEVCGWEGRDLRIMLEARWTELDEADYEAERELFGDLDALDEPATEVAIAPADGAAEEALRVIEELRARDPDDPFWRGVADLRAERGRVLVRFHEGLEPRDLPAGGTRVLCHLHDPAALEAAERIRAGASKPDPAHQDSAKLY